MADPKENMSFYKNEVLTTKGRSSHIANEYLIESDTTEEDGTRVIRLKPKDKTEFLAKARELANAIAERIGEGKSKLFKNMLFDLLKEYEEKSLHRIYKRVMAGKEPVRAEEGCFKIIIGDGRRRNHDEIQLVE